MLVPGILQQTVDLLPGRHDPQGSFSGRNERRSGVGKGEHLAQLLFPQPRQPVIEDVVQNAGAEGIPGTGGLDRVFQFPRGDKHPEPFIIGIAALRAGDDIQQTNVGKRLPQDRRARSKSVVPVINSSSLSAIFRISHLDRPHSIWPRALSIVSHSGGWGLGSKEMNNILIQEVLSLLNLAEKQKSNPT